MDIVTELRQGAYTDSLDDKLMKRAADVIERVRSALDSLEVGSNGGGDAADGIMHAVKVIRSAIDEQLGDKT